MVKNHMAIFPTTVPRWLKRSNMKLSKFYITINFIYYERITNCKNCKQRINCFLKETEQKSNPYQFLKTILGLIVGCDKHLISG